MTPGLGTIRARVSKLSLTLKVARSALHRPDLRAYGRHRAQVAELHVPSSPGPHPVAVVVHGGYWQDQYGKLVTRPLALDLARRGWAAWNIEYRRLGSEGGGWPATFDDIARAVDYLADLNDERLDLDHVVAVGHSAGAQLALWAGARPSLAPGTLGAAPRVVARQVVSLAGVTELRRAGRAAIALVGGEPDEVPERWSQANPMQQIPLRIPVVLAHNRDDRTVSVEHARRYAEAAQAAGGQVTLLEFETGGHRGPINPSEPAWKQAFEEMDTEWSARRGPEAGTPASAGAPPPGVSEKGRLVPGAVSPDAPP